MVSVTELGVNDSVVETGRNLSCVQGEQLSGLVLAKLFPEECQQYVQFMFGKVFPVLATIITVCNLTVVAVFLKPKIRSYTSFMLTLIALSDVMNIICPSMVYIYFYTTGNYTYPVPFHLCRWSYYFGTVFKNLFNTFSVWLTVALAYIRTRCITSPFTACEVHSKWNISRAISIIVVLATAVHAPGLFAYQFKPIIVFSNVDQVRYETCHVTVSEILGTCLLRKLHMWMEVLISSFLPCILLVILSLRMFISLKRAEKYRDSLQSYYNPYLLKSETQDVKSNGIKRHDTHKHEKYVEKEQVNDTSIRNNSVIDYTSVGNDTNQDCDEEERTPSKHWNKRFSGSTVFNSLKSKIQSSRRKTFTKSDSVRSRDSAYERLNRESRRTSWYILLVVAIICSHELPLAGLYSYTLITHQGRLPAVLYGCSTMLIILWQYLTYSLIFLIYCCMCSAFRTELKKTVTCGIVCKSVASGRRLSQGIFTSPCSVRRHISRTQDELGESIGLFKEGEESQCEA